MPDPTDVGRLGHRYFPIIRNNSTAEEETISRAQNIEFRGTYTTEKIYELGRVGPIGSAQDPADMAVTWEVNLYEELRSEFVLSGKDVDVDTSYHMGDLIGENDNELYLLILDTAGNLDDEVQYTDMTVARITWRFQVGAVCTTTIEVEGSGGSWLTTPVHGAQTLDPTSIGGAKGKEARIWFGDSAGSGPTAEDRAFRLQSFTIQAAFPLETVRELGRRQIVGKLANPVDVTMDFDVLAADYQPHDSFFEATGTAYDLTDPALVDVIYVRLYDPDLAEANTAIRAWRIENCRATDTTPQRAQVRGLATSRYALTSESETTADSGGLIVYKGDVA
jgi:hypothetical protein